MNDSEKTTRYEKEANALTTVVGSILVLCVLVLMLLTAGTYRSVIQHKAANTATRSSLSFLKTQIKNHDSCGSVSIAEDGTILELYETAGEDRYVLRFYILDGNLVQEYSFASMQQDPERAVSMMKEKIFHVRLVQPGLMEITTSEGTELVAIMAEGEPQS